MHRLTALRPLLAAAPARRPRSPSPSPFSACFSSASRSVSFVDVANVDVLPLRPSTTRASSSATAPRLHPTASISPIASSHLRRPLSEPLSLHGSLAKSSPIASQAGSPTLARCRRRLPSRRSSRALRPTRSARPSTRWRPARTPRAPFTMSMSPALRSVSDECQLRVQLSVRGARLRVSACPHCVGGERARQRYGRKARVRPERPARPAKTWQDLRS